MAEPTASLPTDEGLLALPDTRCVGACGPTFETPLLEQLFNRVRGAVSRPVEPEPGTEYPPGTGR